MTPTLALPAIEQLVAGLGCSVACAEVAGVADGYYRPRTGEIAIEASLPANAKLRTQLREAAHALLDRESDAELSYAGEVVVVETAGHVAASAIGLDTAAPWSCRRRRS